MHISSSSKRNGFTLVEMLVVIALIAIVAAISVSAVRGIQRQARATKCQANLHALHQAVMQYYSDHSGKYPNAGGYEWRDSQPYSDSEGRVFYKYYMYRGWVNHVRNKPKRSRQNSDGYTEYYDPEYNLARDNKTHANQYVYVGPGNCNKDTSDAGNEVMNRVMRSIDEGAIFKYTDKNYEIYVCPEVKGEHPAIMRSYLMNMIFGSHRTGSESTGLNDAMTSRLALFVEMNTTAIAGSKNSCANVTVTDGSKMPLNKKFYNDAVWDWDDKEEMPGYWHRKSGKNYTHIIFADGHIESHTGLTMDDCERFGEGLE